MTSSKICVVTGANKGIGFAIMKELCSKFDGIVYLTARDESRGLAAIERLNQLGHAAKFHQLDIEDSASISQFANYLKEKYGGLDVLVNNAGMAYKNAALEPFEEHADRTIDCNYFGTKALCHALFPLLRPGARVCNVSSSLGHLTEIDGTEPQATSLRSKFASPSLTEDELDNMMWEYVKLIKEGKHSKAGWPESIYVVSKVGVSALTRIQQRVFDKDERADLVVNSCHPGYVDTDMTKHQGPMSVEAGAICPSYLALLPPNTEIRGAYLWHDTKLVDWVNGPVPNIF